jgi:hypothetical protein
LEKARISSMEKIDFSSFDKQLVELYSKNMTEYEDESFSLGYILMELDSFIVFMSISEIGTLESIQLRSKKFIKNIVSNTEYTKMYDFFVSYSKKMNAFDGFSLEESVALNENTTPKEILNTALKLNKTISIITSLDESILTGKIVLLDINRLVLSLLDYENIEIDKKQSVSLETIICIDLVSIENYLYDKYLEMKNSN